MLWVDDRVLLAKETPAVGSAFSFRYILKFICILIIAWVWNWDSALHILKSRGLRHHPGSFWAQDIGFDRLYICGSFEHAIGYAFYTLRIRMFIVLSYLIRIDSYLINKLAGSIWTLRRPIAISCLLFNKYVIFRGPLRHDHGGPIPAGKLEACVPHGVFGDQ